MKKNHGDSAATISGEVTGTRIVFFFFFGGTMMTVDGCETLHHLGSHLASSPRKIMGCLDHRFQLVKGMSQASTVWGGDCAKSFR